MQKSAVGRCGKCADWGHPASMTTTAAMTTTTASCRSSRPLPGPNAPPFSASGTDGPSPISQQDGAASSEGRVQRPLLRRRPSGCRCHIFQAQLYAATAHLFFAMLSRQPLARSRLSTRAESIAQLFAHMRLQMNSPKLSFLPTPLHGFFRQISTSRPRDATRGSFSLVRTASPEPLLVRSV